MALTLMPFMVFITLYGKEKDTEYFNWAMIFVAIYFILYTNV